ncbi:MAG: hypothetical protein LBG64_00915 [Pseudomonadales bacterium]|jgi:hypothetical protein|nr:hypothetical protein [Pseudomonadales bacterium]
MKNIVYYIMTAIILAVAFFLLGNSGEVESAQRSTHFRLQIGARVIIDPQTCVHYIVVPSSTSGSSGGLTPRLSADEIWL